MRSVNLFGIGLLLVLSTPTNAQWVNRSYDLEEGWNAIFLDVEPFPSASEDHFTGKPVKGIWTRRDDGSTIQVVGPVPQLLAEESELWRAYFPPETGHSEISDLAFLETGRAYLIEASESFTWSFKGRPTFADRKWREGSLNLTGFYAGGGNPAAISDFLKLEPTTGIAAAFDLLPTGGWTPITDPNTPIIPGKAYLVRGEFRRGAGSIEYDLPTGKRLEFPRDVNQQILNLTCEEGQSPTVQLLISASVSAPTESPSLGQDPAIPVAGPVQARWKLAEDPYGRWRDFPGFIRMDGEATPELEVRVAINRLAMGAGGPDDLYQAILNVADDSGYHRQFGIVGESLDPTGLWMGTVTLDAVSAPFEQGIEQSPEYTPAQTEFRVLVHVDDDGELKLIDEATQMWRPIEGQEDGGEFVLVTRSVSDSLRNELSSGLASGAIPRPLRISAINFDLRDSNNNPMDLPLTGEFVPGSTLEGTFVLQDQNPTNPFHHKYHPDLTWYANPLPSQIWNITRDISIFLDPQQSSQEAEAGWGDSWMRGTYSERIEGIHEYPIQVAGTVEFRRLSRIGQLNGE